MGSQDVHFHGFLVNLGQRHIVDAGASGVQWLAGIAAIVLGVLAVAGVRADILALSALIALGATLVLTGSSLNATVVGLVRPSARPAE